MTPTARSFSYPSSTSESSMPAPPHIRPSGAGGLGRPFPVDGELLGTRFGHRIGPYRTSFPIPIPGRRIRFEGRHAVPRFRLLWSWPHTRCCALRPAGIRRHGPVMLSGAKRGGGSRRLVALRGVPGGVRTRRRAPAATRVRAGEVGSGRP